MKKLTGIKQLKLKANDIRKDIIKMLLEAKSGHSAGPLGMADVFTALYFNVLKHNPKKPDWADRDYFVLSNGHICPGLYTTMAHAGYFGKRELMTLRKLGTRLQGHPHRETLPGLETTSGPLGSGLSQAAGMALALKMDNKKNRVICMTSDGEHDAGNTWEGAMFAAANKLDNLTVILDRNNIQIDGDTEDIMPLEPIVDKYKAFNWHVIEIDAHNIREIIDAFMAARSVHDMPTMIIGHNIPGKGVSFMENDYTWHGKPPKEDEAKIALKELNEIEKKIKRGQY